MVMQSMHRSSIGTGLLFRRVDHLFDRSKVREIAIDTSQHSAGSIARFGLKMDEVVTDGLAKGIDLVTVSLSRGEGMRRDNRGLCLGHEAHHASPRSATVAP